MPIPRKAEGSRENRDQLPLTARAILITLRLGFCRRWIRATDVS